MRQLKITKQLTNRDTLALEKYLQEVNRIDLITPEEEITLAKKIKQGDKAALDKMVMSNLRFVISVAKQYQNQGLSLPDLINEGNIGLIKATERFDETRGFKFISYAVWWIRQAILHALAVNGRLVRLPLNKIGAINKIHVAISNLEQELNREPTEEEISEVTNLSIKIVKENIGNTKHISMDAPVGEKEDYTLYDIIGIDESKLPDDKLDKESLSIEINNILSILSERDLKIIKMYYGLEDHPKTLDEIGEEFNLTSERVRQIRQFTIRRLKQSNRYKKLKTYLD
jgi:RNA polymerase primary sigma factor